MDFLYRFCKAAKLKLWFFSLLFLLPGLLTAQSGRTVLTANSPGTVGFPVYLIGSGIQYHQLSWNVSGTVTACSVQVDSSMDGSTWTSGGVISSQTCTTNGNSSYINLNTNYVRINVTSFTGSGSITAIWFGFNTNPATGGGSVTLQTNGANNASQTLLNLVAGTNITLTNTGGGNVTIAASGGSGLPSSWTVNGTTNSVDAQPVPGQDAVTMVFHPSLVSPTADIADFCGDTIANTADCVNKKYVWITANGNLGLNASNFQLSTSTGAAPYFYLNGINAYPGQPYLKTSTAELGIPTLAVANATTGGTVGTGTYYFKITYVNTAGETAGSTEQSTITSGTTSTITVTAPGSQYSAFGYQIYESTTSGGELLVVPTSAICTLASQTFGGNAVCAASANATFTTTPVGASISPPTTNTTGGAYIAAFAPAADGLGMFLTNNAPGADAPLDSGLVLPGGTGVNLTAGATTTANALACLSASNTVSQCAANAANTIIGVFASSGQNSLVQTTGIATVNLAASATTTANDFACSNATAGTIVDNGTTPCASGQQVGIIAATNGVAVTSVPVVMRFAQSSEPADATATVGVTAIAANTCVAQTAVTMPGVTTSMSVNLTATSDTSAVTGWGSPSAGLLYITDYPSANTVNWKVCNPTSASITPSASVTFNVSAR